MARAGAPAILGSVMNALLRRLTPALALASALGAGAAVTALAGTAHSAPSSPYSAVRASAGFLPLTGQGTHLLASAPQPTPQEQYADYAGLPSLLPPYRPPASPLPPCDAVAIPHPSGFSEFGGTGGDTVGTPGQGSQTFPAYHSHGSLEAICLESTTSGGVLVDVVVEATPADPSEYRFEMGPAGLSLVSVTFGKGVSAADTVPVGIALGAWPQTGCVHAARSGLANGDSIDDTFCFDASGALRHFDLHERATESDGTTRAIDESLDRF